MMELLEVIARRKAPEGQIQIHLVTLPDDGNVMKQYEHLGAMVAACEEIGVDFSWTCDGLGVGARPPHCDQHWIEDIVGSRLGHFSSSTR